MSRYWICYRQRDRVKCLQRNPRIKQKCEKCGAPRPSPRKPKHMVALEIPYDEYVGLFGERCGICDRPRGEKDRRLDRDHSHTPGGTYGQPRGLLCAKCNKFLHHWMTAAWLRAAADYLERAEA